jgi:5-methylcytosine-specific restriction endonuclease McrA
LLAACLFVLPLQAGAAKRGGQAAGGAGKDQPAQSRQAARSKSVAPASTPRDSRGHIRRDREQRAAFERSHPCPSTGKTSGACPGYVVDHVVPLKRGGADKPSNMQWQTTKAAKEKDRTE